MNFVVFCNFLVCHDFGFIFLPSHGFLFVFQKKKIHIKKKQKKKQQGEIEREIIRICYRTIHALFLYTNLLQVNLVFFSMTCRFSLCMLQSLLPLWFQCKLFINVFSEKDALMLLLGQRQIYIFPISNLHIRVYEYILHVLVYTYVVHVILHMQYT